MLFARLVEYLAELEAITSRNKMMESLARLFNEAEAEDVDKIIYLCQGRVVPAFEKVEFGIGEALAAEALSLATGKGKEEIKRLFREVGDYGSLAERLLPSGGAGLTLSEVFQQLYSLAMTSGEGAVETKTSLLAQLLSRSGAQEGRYLMRIPLGRLRLGIGDPTMMDALSFAKAGDKSLRPELERFYNISSDLGEVARLFCRDGMGALSGLRVQVGKPVRPALAERVSSAKEIIERLGRCAVEPKFDGFRCQVHKRGELVRIFSRNLEDFSEMFPEIVAAARQQVRPQEAIFEGEALAYDPATGDFLPFQMTVQRKRKYDIAAMQEKLPLKLMVFDLLYADGEDLTHDPYLRRRERLEAALISDEVLELAEVLVTEKVEELDRFFADKIQRGLEGVVCKRLDASYQAGKRNFNWIKMKRSYQGQLTDTVDTVVLGYWQGKGARAQFGIGSLLTAVYDAEQDKFVTLARLGTGLTEAEWMAMKEAIDKIAVPERPARVESLLEPDVWAEPRYILEIQADEITRSPMHTCGLGYRSEEAGGRELGFALRFPRAVGFLRQDKSPEEATTLEEILRMYSLQGRKAVEGGEG